MATATNTGETTELGTVFVVDKDPGVRASMVVLFEHLPVAVEHYSSAEEFLNRAEIRPPACVVTDVSLPGMSGLELQAKLRQRSGVPIPIIFVATHSDIPTAVRAVRQGAVDFLEKPFVGRLLLKRVKGALELSSQTRA